MLIKKRGFSLVELLIALLLGSLLLAMIIGLYVTSVATGASSLKYSRLRTDLQAIVSIVETDIRRAGYGGKPFMVGEQGNKVVDSINSTTQNCLIYYYDHDLNGVITSSDKMGFRFVAAKNEIQFGSNVSPLANECYSSGNWVALSDKQFIKITALDFSESIVSSASATARSVAINITGELAADSQYTHVITTKVQVRNLELN